MTNCSVWVRIASSTGLMLVAAMGLAGHGGAQMPPNKTEIRAYKGLFSSVIRGNADETRQLLAKGANPNETDDKGRTPLHIAAHRRNVEIAQILVKGGANPRAKDARGYDMIAIAAVQNDVRFLQTAIKLGADPKASIGSWGGIALNTAAHLGHTDVVKTLIAAGAPVNHRNKAGWTPLIETIVLGDGKAGVQASVAALLAGGADPNIADAKGATPLALARKKGFNEIARLLQKAGGK